MTEKFFGIIDLKIGCFIILLVHLVESLIYIFVDGPDLIFAAILTKDHFPTYEGIMMKLTDDGRIFFYSVRLVMCYYMILAIISMVYALCKNKPGYLSAFMCYAFIFGVASVPYATVLIRDATDNEKGAIIVGVLIAVIKFYFLFVISSQHSEMENYYNQ